MNYHYVRQAQYKKGFFAPLLLAMIAVFLIGGGMYVHQQTKQTNQPVTSTTTAQTPGSNSNVAGGTCPLGEVWNGPVNGGQPGRCVPSPAGGSAISEPATSTASVVPYIGSIFPSSASVGATIQIRGSSLVGFEGDVYFFFKRADGKIARLPGVVSTQTTGDATGAQTAQVVLKESCQQGQTIYGDYSGIATQCDYVQLTPGIYTVYTTPWGKKSNEVNFTVTAS